VYKTPELDRFDIDSNSRSTFEFQALLGPVKESQEPIRPLFLNITQAKVSFFRAFMKL